MILWLGLNSYAKMPVMTPNANTPNVMLVTYEQGSGTCDDDNCHGLLQWYSLQGLAMAGLCSVVTPRVPLVVGLRYRRETPPEALSVAGLSSAKSYFVILSCFFGKSEAFRVSDLGPGAAHEPKVPQQDMQGADGSERK